MDPEEVSFLMAVAVDQKKKIWLAADDVLNYLEVVGATGPKEQLERFLHNYQLGIMDPNLTEKGFRILPSVKYPKKPNEPESQ